MGNDNPSRKDVARLAGVSETVVSYVLNNNRYVKKEKREAVLAAVRQLNYKPNRFALGLKGKSSKHIVLLLDRIRTEAVGELISEIDSYSEEKGYMTSLSLIENSEQFVQKVIGWQVDGVVISSINFESRYIQMLVDSGIAVVVLENREYKGLEGAVMINTGLYLAARESVSYLFSSGCRKIGYIDRISEHGHFSDYSDYRLRGYCDEADYLKLERIVVTGCRSSAELEEKLNVLFEKGSIDAFFCRTDEIACVALNAAHRAGLKVPEDVSIIGLDNTSASRTSYPTLSSVRLRRKDFAKAAVDAIESSNRSSGNFSILFEPELIIRESVRKLPALL